MRRIHRRPLGFIVALIAFSIAGLAFAAWTTSGTGSATAKAKSAQALTTVDVSATTTATLYPGATGDAFIRIANPNEYPVNVTAISLNGTNASITADAGHSGCTTTGVSFTDQTGLSIAVAAGGNATETLTGAVAMSNASLNACQGATFTIPVTVTGASAA